MITSSLPDQEITMRTFPGLDGVAVAIDVTGATVEPTAFPGWGPGWRITTL
jgi:hypothetical protein